MKRIFISVLFLVSAIFAAAETALKAPTQHFTDHAGVVSKELASQLDSKLAALEQSDSTQFYVVIYPKLDTESSLEDYTQRTAAAWKVGQKDKNNGLILFLFVDDGTGRKAIRYEVGYGLEGAFTDAQSKLIIEKEIIPALKVNNWSVAVNSGIDSAVKAIKGEHAQDGVKKDTSVLKMWMLYVIIGVWLVSLCFAPRLTLELTGHILNIVLALASGGKGGSSGGGGSFGGGGSSGRT